MLRVSLKVGSKNVRLTWATPVGTRVPAYREINPQIFFRFFDGFDKFRNSSDPIFRCYIFCNRRNRCHCKSFTLILPFDIVCLSHDFGSIGGHTYDHAKRIKTIVAVRIPNFDGIGFSPGIPQVGPHFLVRGTAAGNHAACGHIRRHTHDHGSQPDPGKARSRRAPPAAISARTDFDSAASGVRSPTYFKMLVGVRTKGAIRRAPGVFR